MSSTRRIAIGQMRCAVADVEMNLRRIGEDVDRAVDDGADLLVFPELALTGYLVDARFSDVATRLDDPIIDELRGMSQRVSLCVGLIEETPTTLFYNSAVYFEAGMIRHVHRKIYLPTYGRFDERRYYAAGWSVQAFDCSIGRIAMLVCGDAWHLPLAYLAAHDGADVLVIIAASSREGLTETTPCDDAWQAMCRSYALTLSCFVVFANHGGVNNGIRFWGGSFVAGPDGNVMFAADEDVEAFVSGTVDMATLRQQRVRLPLRRDDSLVHTIELAKRIAQSKLERDRFLDVTHANGLAAPKPR